MLIAQNLNLLPSSPELGVTLDQRGRLLVVSQKTEAYPG